MGATQRDLFAEHQHRMSRACALRVALGDGQWHTSTELAKAVGHRFGASILIVSRGEDGCAPWLIRRERVKTNGSVWRYKFERLALPHEFSKEETWKARAQRAEREVFDLSREVGRLNQIIKRLAGSQEVLSLGGRT